LLHIEDEAGIGEKDLYDFKLGETRDEKELLNNGEVQRAIKTGKKASVELAVRSTDRTFGTLLGAEITRKAPAGLKEDTITVSCRGSGGQSFGAFIPAGLTLKLSGDCNDYLGKGLSGGKLIVAAAKAAKYDPEENMIAGNVALYGATSGQAYIAGKAGERFAVRNSGATAVVEGVGEHGCEYMTGGTVVVLGSVGKNFAAGMSGGVAYVLDEDNTLYKNLNKQLVSMEVPGHKEDIAELRKLIAAHEEATHSRKAGLILSRFEEYIPHFKKIIPADYKEIRRLIAKEMEAGADDETAKIEAFRTFTGGAR
ncbi:MAG: glutamate synthase subunit alpha, partial [Lachnospiraceae bacterium]|nr:glutamate synthase subunit alpha [Lachnospiraceae bacterium]